MTEPNWALARKAKTLADRARIMTAIRAFFTARNYLEVETPHRIPANAPEPYIDPIASGEWALQTSPELAMKRLLAAGYEQLFQICRVWREGEHGRQHLPEFTMLEWYRCGVDYTALMDECEGLLKALVPEQKLFWRGAGIDLSHPWERLTVAEAFTKHASMTLDEALTQDCFDEILVTEIEPKLGCRKPLFLTEYPTELAALARKKPGQPNVAERFELYIGGLELANAFSELTDPEEQRHRFERDESARVLAGKPAYPLPEKFLAEMPCLPESAGIALGIDRLVMLLTDTGQIDQVVAFTATEL